MRIDRVLWSAPSVAHIARHGITPEEVENVLFNPPLDARRGEREGTYLVFGAAWEVVDFWLSSCHVHVTAGMS